MSCPACDENAISVAASDWLDEHAYYTNYGPGLDIIAPGGELYGNTTDEAGIYSSVRNGYAYFQGTSMSAPQVTGTAAVVASVTGDTGGDLRARLEWTTDDLGPGGRDEQFGWGRLNTYQAVTALLPTGPPVPPAEPLAASFTFSCSDVSCTFDASGSTGSPVTWDWTFGHDGATGSGETVLHDFPAVTGTYTVTLTVGDGSGTDTTTDTVSCKKRGRNGVQCT